MRRVGESVAGTEVDVENLTMMRGGDMVGRMGGEEFGVFLPGADPRQASDVAERIRSNVATSSVEHLQGKPLTVSVGGVTFGNAARSNSCMVQPTSCSTKQKRPAETE